MGAHGSLKQQCSRGAVLKICGGFVFLNEEIFVFLNKVGQGGAGATSFSRLESKVPDVLLCSGESLTTKNRSTSHLALKSPVHTPVGKTCICGDLGLESIAFYTQPQK